MIRLENIKFTYNDEQLALDDVSLNIEEGSYTTIVGHNGSGKSTISRIIVGLLEAQSGSVYFKDNKLDDENMMEFRSDIGIVFQNPDNQFIGNTVADDIAFGLENHNVKQEKMQSIIEEYAEKVNMLKFLNHEPQKLSGGQKQRVAIAGILAMRPSVIILDEATSMLDPKGKAEINKFIKDIHKLYNLTIISITHDMEEVASSDKVIVMNKGKVAMQGLPKEIMIREKELKELQLDVPFAWKLSSILSERNININKSIELQEVVNQLCQLKVKN